MYAFETSIRHIYLKLFNIYDYSMEDILYSGDQILLSILKLQLNGLEKFFSKD